MVVKETIIDIITNKVVENERPLTENELTNNNTLQNTQQLSLEEEIIMLKECILEISEIIYAY